MESIRAAVHAGADAVYAGGRLFGARAYADNPEKDALLEVIDYCHLYGVKLYLTVNTLLKEYELTQMLPEYLAPIYEHGVDAVLVQDFGVFHFLKHAFPDLPLHASTQMTVTGPDGVRLLKEMGAERVVLSRELSLAEIQAIRKKCDVELETFVHGALCYCYSGKCLMSSMIGGRSGNRGRCAQPCRLPWDLYESQDSVRGRRSLNDPSQQYLLSPKDICTLRLLPELIDAGISSLKIEGRMKSPEYTAGVTAMYRKYIDLYLEKGRKGYHVDAADEKLLAQLFSRGAFSEGYYQERNGRDMMTLEQKNAPAGQALRQAQETVQQIRERYVDSAKKIPLSTSVRIHSREKVCMRVSDRNGHSCVTEGSIPLPAKNKPADAETIRRQIAKSGNTDFLFESIDIDLEEGLFVPIRDLNELRRNALEEIRREMLKPYRRQKRDVAAQEGIIAQEDIIPQEDAYGISHPRITASVCMQEQLEAVLEANRIGGVYLDLALCTARNAERTVRSGKKVYLMLPEIWRADTAQIVSERMKQEFGSFSSELKQSLNGVLVRSYDQLYALQRAGLCNETDGFEVIADASLYTWNHCAREQIRALGATMDTLPAELSFKELSERGCAGSEAVIYGYLPLMTSTQCLMRTVTGCKKKPGVHMLRDRKGVLFAVKNDCMLCLNTIYNSVPLELVSLSGQIRQLNPLSVRYQFTIEGKEETRRVLEGNLPDAVTRGHFRKGVM